MGEHAHTFVQMSHPPTLTTLNFYAYFIGKPMGYHMHLLPQPLSSCSVDPLYFTILCSTVSESTLIVNEDQAIDGVDVAQPSYVVIYDEYDLESEHQPMMKDDLLLPVPPPLFPHIFGDSAMSDFPCVNSPTNASNFDHL